jgi:tetratricopeptide (TPR) repeat protein
MSNAPFSTATPADMGRYGQRIPIRRHFGIEAFGVNAFSAGAGEDVIGDHTEQTQRHEEIYLVTAGTATFAIGDDEFDAPAGTIVFIGDPLVRRRATAKDADTTVLAVGAARGAAYEVSPWEVITDFWPRYEAKDYEGAIEVLRAARERFPDNSTIVYNLACCTSLLGRRDEALDLLEEALERAPEMAGFARRDSDLEPLAEDTRFDRLLSRAEGAAPDAPADAVGGYSVAAIDDVEAQPGVEGSTWLRVRRHFGVGAFGVNAYRADEAGGRVIEEHDEESLGHEELYVVLRGRARFTLGDEDVDAPAGTYVFVRDPGTRRGAHAEEPGTTVLAVGAKPGAAFEVSAWEDFADAFPHYHAGEYDRAIEVFREKLEQHPDHASGLYNLACCESLSGDTEAAIEHLTRSLELDERFREYARTDEDFAAIRDDPRFASAVAGEAQAAGASS